MRVVSGKARGLKLKTIESDSTRPTKDMVKEALFSMLTDVVENATVLDLFAGSGQIALEALSRGAKEAYLCDLNKECIKVINENFEKAHLSDTIKLFNEDYQATLQRIKDVRFEIIYIDPPYNKDLGTSAIMQISSLDLLKKNGVLIFETDTNEEAPDFIGIYEKFKTKKYGRNVLSFYRRKE